MKTNYDSPMPPQFEWKLFVRSNFSVCSHQSIAMINDFLFFSVRWCIEKPLFSSSSTVGMINSSNVASTLAPDIKVGIWRRKKGLIEPCHRHVLPICILFIALVLHLVLRGDYVTTSEGCMRVHNSIFDCLLAAFPRYTWFSRMHTVTRRLGFIINIKRTPSAGSESN